ncbi:hypothetical protein ERJ75_000862400 [Trypanosoma vivax]|uniref:Uncharacterized protein n=1 Tax=Trypanosoma vivax (strain Y486) TaxID=1055687 RepID=F9WMC1_TRYVY|nr:hypothetical protein ERJ75_000862400 [Trypanosoma vivax]CCD18674.1 hypothetical protein, conserved in T. vivax [Trypanosoma vivax Y486]|eukprot:CCD18674.1 hypothetical protein, conserved in T. vivax [Trypanosoma vivax Y486]
MASRIALLLMCLSLCVTAARGEVSAETDPLALMNETFSNMEKETCATALLCLWLEVVQLPRRRMIERIDTIFERFRGLVNISAERARLEDDDTFKNMTDAQEVLQGIKSKLYAVNELESKIDKQRLALLSALQNGTAVVGKMNDAIGAIGTVTLQITKEGGSVQISLPHMKEKLSKLSRFEDGMTVAKKTVDCIMETWWKGDTQQLIDNLKRLIKNSSSICSKRFQRRMRRPSYDKYIDAIEFAARYKEHVINYTNTIGSIDRFGEGQRNASGNTTSQLLSNGFAKQLEDILSDMNALKVSVREIRKERAQLLAAKRKNEEERRHSCTDLWSQLLTLVRLK